MKKRVVKIFLILLICTCTYFLYNRLEVKADSGWDTSYDSGGSWDSGSSWSSSSSLDSWDSESSSRRYSSGRSCSNPDECPKQLNAIIFFIIVVISIIILINVLMNKKNQTISSSKNYKKQLSHDEVEKIIPGFDIEEFNFEAYKIFYDVQIAWMNFDYDKLKELLSDELYNTYLMDLDALKVKNMQNVMSNFKLLNCSTYKLDKINGKYIAEVELNVQFYDYVIDINTKKVLRGSELIKLNNTYILTFEKSISESFNINECPRCGAQVEGNQTGVCEYCKSKLINDNFDWVLVKKIKICQK